IELSLNSSPPLRKAPKRSEEIPSGFPRYGSGRHTSSTALRDCPRTWVSRKRETCVKPRAVNGKWLNNEPKKTHIMSFGKSFERELGKNTGKWVSNVIFGDGHSTPYRRVGSTQHREPRRTQAELRHELEIQRIAMEERIRRNQIAAENKRQKKEQNLLIDSAVLQNIDMISSIKVTNNSEQLVDLLSDLSIQVKTNKWHGNNEEGKIRNKYNE